VADDWRLDATRRAKVALIDTTTPNAARVGDFLYGGRDNFEADRRAARALVAAAPVLAVTVPAMRAFQRRVVRHLAAEAGIRQFLDIGSRLSASGSTHEVAQSVAPECRIVYVDSDPVVLAHARALTTSTPGGATSVIDADFRDPDVIVADARSLLDFSQPVAVLLLFMLAHVEDITAASAIVTALADGMPPGSYIAVDHMASDLDPALPEAFRQWNKMATQSITIRSRSEVASLVAGLDLVPPGLVPINEWRPAPDDPPAAVVPMYGVVAKKR
jgi:S-adenosyl methyltransferase